MLYLAEVKKQVKEFLSRNFKTELKLLAWQHNDKTWSAVQAEEVVASNEVPKTGEGALFLVKLTQNRQIEETPEFAAPELVRQLQRLSRLSEKLKDQRQEIEQWKESLTYQSEELSRRSLEVESRQEQVEQAQQQLQFLEQERHELEASWKRLRQTQQQQPVEQPLSPDNFPGLTLEQAQSLRELSARLSGAGGGSDLLIVPLDRLWEILQSQQALLSGCRQELEQQQAMVGYWRQDVQHQEEILALHRQELEASSTSLEQIKIQFQGEQVSLIAKQELYRRLERHWQEIEGLQLTTERLIPRFYLGNPGSTSQPQVESGKAIPGESLALKLDLEAIENMPLEKLQTLISQLEDNYAKSVHFVNDQEEELALQTQTVRELEAKLVVAGEEELNLETLLAEEKEKRQMLYQTLLGQRRNLDEREKIVQAHRQILLRRRGTPPKEESVENDPDILRQQLETYDLTLEEELKQLQREIEHLEESLQRFAIIIEQQEAAQKQKAEALKIEENNWQQAKFSLVQTQARLELYTQSLQPLQQQWQEIEQIWYSIRTYI